MKLVQLLAKKLKEWPDGVDVYAQDANGKIYPWVGIPSRDEDEWLCEGAKIHQGKSWFSGEEKKPCDDHMTANVTESQWQSEREKMNKPKWIQHRGGKCPVKAGTKVVTRYRDGVVGDWCMTRDEDANEECLTILWSHNGGNQDIMAYYVEETKDQEIEEVRKFSKDVDMNIGKGEIIHGPVSIGDTVITAAHPKLDTNLGTITYKLEIDAIDANKEIDSLVAKWGQIVSPLKWRDEIIALEAYEEEFRREREKLIRKLESEGFKLIDHMTPVYGEQIIGMNDWQNWKVGDIVCATQAFDSISIGEELTITRIDHADEEQPIGMSNGSSCVSWPETNQVKFVRRP